MNCASVHELCVHFFVGPKGGVERNQRFHSPFGICTVRETRIRRKRAILGTKSRTVQLCMISLSIRGCTDAQFRSAK